MTTTTDHASVFQLERLPIGPMAFALIEQGFVGELREPTRQVVDII